MNILSDIWTKQRRDAFRPVIEAHNHGREAIRKAFSEMDEEHRNWAIDLTARARLPMLAASAFVFPILSEYGCQHILDKAKSYAYAPNLDEDPEYQMEEVVLSVADPCFSTFLRRALIETVGPAFLMTRGRLPSTISSLQLARYGATDKAPALHIDRDSTYSCAINLSNDHEGGGFIFADGLLGNLTVPSLPNGCAVFFDGRHTLHAGRPVSRGTQNLLVLWAAQDADNW